MNAQTTTRTPVQLLTRSIVLFLVALAIVVVIVTGSGRPGATASTAPAGVHHAVPAPSPGPMAAARGYLCVSVADTPAATLSRPG